MQDSLRTGLIEYLASASKSEKAIGSYMLANMSGIPFETAATLAAKVGVSEPTVGRFCRSLGYPHFKAFKAVLKADIGDRPWLIGDRLQEFRERSRSSADELSRSLDLEIAGLVAVYEIAQSQSWKRAVALLSTTPQIFVAGFQTERGIAQIFVNQMEYIRAGVRLLDLAGGNFAELLLADPKQSCLVVYEARRYSRLAQMLVQEAHTPGIPIILVTDEFCDWGRELADEMFVVQTQFNLFWDSTAQMVSLTNLLINGVFAALGPSVETRMNRTSELYSGFIGYVGDPTGPKLVARKTKHKKGEDK
jgi:DNA-binding MurR/RpiR family transcriptional regulator